MRALFAFLLFLGSVAMAAEAPDALETARRLAAAGAPQLALNHAEQAQPRDPVAPRWAEWEALRLNLLARLDRNRELLERAAALPATLPPAQSRELLTLAVRAAVAAKQGADARKYAARLLWQLDPSANDLREIRLLVIESLAADGRGTDAFHSMLRFQQDYRPLDRPTAARFVELLLDLGMVKGAVNWLAGLDDGSPVKLLLRFKSGLVPAAAATAQARAKLAKGGDAGFWQVLAQVGAQQGDRALQIEAQEHLLRQAPANDPQRSTAQARALWQTYLAAAQEAANRNQLLTGDDAGWADFAARHPGISPFLSRAFFAYLAQRAQTDAARHQAQLQLVRALRAGKLDLAALRLFQESGIAPTALDAGARQALGEIAADRNLPEVALAFWGGLGPPSDSDGDAWRLRMAQVALRAGKADMAAAALRQVIAGKQALAPESAQRSAMIAEETLDAGRPDLAGGLFETLLPLTGGADLRRVLFDLGRINEAAGRSPAAAGYYLRSALLAGTGAPDAFALQARLQAAMNLSRAGYRDDARAQFEWLLKNSRDAAQLEIARRELKRLL